MEIKRKTWMAFMSAIIAFIGTVAILMLCYSRSKWSEHPRQVSDLEEVSPVADQSIQPAVP
jgi:hypothetical protein